MTITTATIGLTVRTGQIAPTDPTDRTARRVQGVAVLIRASPNRRDPVAASIPDFRDHIRPADHHTGRRAAGVAAAVAAADALVDQSPTSSVMTVELRSSVR